jgi:hypothetical protein
VFYVQEKFLWKKNGREYHQATLWWLGWDTDLNEGFEIRWMKTIYTVVLTLVPGRENCKWFIYWHG